MFGIGSAELIIILIVALIIIGPKKLPELMKTLGKGIAEFRNISSSVKDSLDKEIETAEHEKRKEDAETILAEKKEKAGASKAEPKTEVKIPEAKAEAKKTTAKAGVRKAEPKTDAKAEVTKTTTKKVTVKKIDIDKAAVDTEKTTVKTTVKPTASPAKKVALASKKTTKKNDELS